MRLYILFILFYTKICLVVLNFWILSSKVGDISFRYHPLSILQDSRPTCKLSKLNEKIASWKCMWVLIEIKLLKAFTELQKNGMKSQKIHEVKFKGLFTLVHHQHCAQVCLMHTVRNVWLVWGFCILFKHGAIPWPWHSWKRCTSAQYGWSCISELSPQLPHCIIDKFPNVSVPYLNKKTPSKPQSQWSCIHVLPLWWRNKTR